VINSPIWFLSNPRPQHPCFNYGVKGALLQAEENLDAYLYLVRAIRVELFLGPVDCQERQSLVRWHDKNASLLFDANLFPDRLYWLHLLANSRLTTSAQGHQGYTHCHDQCPRYEAQRAEPAGLEGHQKDDA
jgi:hypothetical protein